MSEGLISILMETSATTFRKNISYRNKGIGLTMSITMLITITSEINTVTEHCHPKYTI